MRRKRERKEMCTEEYKLSVRNRRNQGEIEGIREK